MLKRLLFLLLSTGFGFGLKAQSDTLLEATVWDYGLKPDPSYKTEHFDPDSGFFAADLGQMLEMKSAVMLKAYGGSGIATMSLRGANAAQTQVYWNGLQINSPTLGLSDLSTLPAAAFDAAELQYGFASLQQGSGALGGSLHLSSDPWQRRPSLAVQLTGGSFSRLGGRIEGAYGGENWRGQTKLYRWQAQNNFSFPNISKEGQPTEELQNAALTRQGIAQDLSLRLGEKKLLSAYLWGNLVDRQLPAPLTGNQEQYDSLQDQQLAAVLRYEQAFKTGKLLASSGWLRANNTFFNGRDSSSNNNAFSSWQNQVRYQYNWTNKLALEVAWQMHLERARSAAFSEQVERQQHSLLTNLGYQLTPKDHFQAMLRPMLVDGDLKPLLFSIGYDRQWDSSWTSRLHLGRNFRLPTLNDLYWQPGGNLGLQPELSTNLEAGLGWESPRAFWPSLDVTFFHNLVRNWIQWQPQGSYWSPVNLKRVAQSGLEFKAENSHSWSKWSWNYTLLYNYLRVYTTASSATQSVNLGKQLAYVPFHQARIINELRYGQWRLGYQWAYHGQYFVSSDNQVYMPAYPLHSIRLSWRQVQEESDHCWQASLQVQNLGNRPYQVIPYRPEPGLHFLLQINYLWQY